MQNVLAAQLEPRSTEELAGAFRALCGMMLTHTAMSLRRRVMARNDDAYQKKAARVWMSSHEGAITFDECCAVYGLDPRRASAAICRFAGKPRCNPMNIANRRRDHARVD